MNTKLKSTTLAALAATAILLGGCAAGEPAPQFVIDDSTVAAREAGAGTAAQLEADDGGDLILGANEAAEAQAASIGRSVDGAQRISSVLLIDCPQVAGSG